MSWGVALRNAVGLGLGGVPSLLNAPPYASLAFNFLSGQLDPRITFSRTSNATLVGSNGQIQYAPHNLLTYSEQFDNAAWSKFQGTVTANATISPDGTTTADVFIPDTNAGDHGIVGLLTSQDLSVTRTFSVYLKASGLTTFAIYVRNNAQTIGIQGNVDLSAGTITASNYGAPISVLTPTITAVGNGWFRCTIGGALSATTETLRVGILRNFTGDGVSGLYVWGAQLNVGALQPYYSTTVKNLQGFSQEFDNAAWTKSNSTITADVTAAPDGSMTADKLVEDTAATIGHYVTPSSPGALALGQVVTYSAYAKAAERTFLQLILTGVGPASSNLVAGFDLTTGTAGTPSATATSRIVAVGDGWYRCSITVPVATAGTPTQQIRISLNSSSTPSSYTGDGTSGIFIWGAQFSDSASLDPYVYNPAAAPSNTAYYGPRFDYDPVTLAPKGLLIEEQRTNLVFPSEDFAAASWSIYNATIVVDAGTAPNGTLTADRIDSSGAGIFRAGVGVVNATAYTYSVFLKHVSGTGIISNIGFERFGAVPLAGSSSFNLLTGTVISNGASVTASSITAFGNGWYRVLVTVTSTDVTTTLIHYAPAGDQFLMWGAQLEQGAFPTSYIPTATAAATRATDVLSITGANFSSWYNAVEGTMFAEFGPYANGGASKNFGIAHIDDGTSNNMIRLFAGSTISPVFAVTASNVTQAYLSSEVIAPASVSRIAGAYKTDNFARSVNGTVAATDLLGTVPAVNRLLIGNGLVGVNELNGHIRSFKYYPTRLSNTKLQALTALTTLPWTPAALGASLALWLDANDASTITLNGSTVSQWGDKSGNGRNAVQATAATQPVYSATSFNGKPTLTWDGIDDAMQIAMSLPATDLNLFAVLAPNVATQSDYIFDIPTVRRVFSTSGQIFSGSWLPSAAPITAGGQRLYGFTTGPANQITYSDGTAISTIAALSAAVVDGSVGLGNRNVSGGPFGLDGKMSELVFVSGTLPTLDRQKIEGYLAWKWGLQANLPVGHPYKDAPPTV